MPFCPLWTVSSIMPRFTLCYLAQHKAIYTSFYSQTKQTSIKTDQSSGSYCLPTGRGLGKWCMPWWMLLESNWRGICAGLRVIVNCACPWAQSTFTSAQYLVRIDQAYTVPSAAAVVKTLLGRGDENMHTNIVNNKNDFRWVFIGLKVQI